MGARGSQRRLPVLKASTIYLEFRKGIDDGRLTINLSPTRCFMSDPGQVSCLVGCVARITIWGCWAGERWLEDKQTDGRKTVDLLCYAVGV